MNLTDSTPTQLKWLIPYYQEVKPLLPKHTLSKINHIPLQKGKIQRIWAQIWKIKYSYKFELSIYTETWQLKSLKPVKRKRMAISKIDLLCTFAHELAHIAHWYHTPQHKTLECLILMTFMGKLQENGYISEEFELKRRKKP